jgi:hypothetical protein
MLACQLCPNSPTYWRRDPDPDAAFDARPARVQYTVAAYPVTAKLTGDYL